MAQLKRGATRPSPRRTKKAKVDNAAEEPQSQTAISQTLSQIDTEQNAAFQTFQRAQNDYRAQFKYNEQFRQTIEEDHARLSAKVEDMIVLIQQKQAAFKTAMLPVLARAVKEGNADDDAAAEIRPLRIEGVKLTPALHRASQLLNCSKSLLQTYDEICKTEIDMPSTISVQEVFFADHEQVLKALAAAKKVTDADLHQRLFGNERQDSPVRNDEQRLAQVVLRRRYSGRHGKNQTRSGGLGALLDDFEQAASSMQHIYIRDMAL